MDSELLLAALTDKPQQQPKAEKHGLLAKLRQMVSPAEAPAVSSPLPATHASNDEVAELQQLCSRTRQTLLLLQTPTSSSSSSSSRKAEAMTNSRTSSSISPSRTQQTAQQLTEELGVDGLPAEQLLEQDQD
ncbi:hypothetical protein COO60DRAFT_1634267 [Scenedesmus sp. NREL 46B-D3]|nr:hypothetical protein COO60DRAFT_1634267 [Scenedesmus sp. NREL 46B-D3]